MTERGLSTLALFTGSLPTLSGDGKFVPLVSDEKVIIYNNERAHGTGARDFLNRARISRLNFYARYLTPLNI